MAIVRIQLLIAAALTLCLGLPTTAAAEGPSQEFKQANLAWTLPDEWEFKELDPQAKEGGHLIAAVSPGNDVYAAAFAQGTDLSVDERAGELQSMALPHFLDGGISRKKIISSTLSGEDAKVVVAEGKYKSGATGHVRLYVMAHRGKLYHLEIRTYNNAHVDRRDEVNALRQGFRLIKGAKNKDKSEKFDEFPARADGADGDGGADGDSSGDGDEWPAKGPKRDGKKLIFTGLNVEWSIDGTPLTWEKPISDLKNAFELTDKGVTSSVLVECVGRIKRVKKEDFEKDDPDWNFARGWFSAFQVPFGRDIGQAMRSTRIQEQLQREFGLGEIKSSGTRVIPDVKIGNLRSGGKGTGYMLKLVAENRNGSEITILLFEVGLKGYLYRWKFVLSGHTDRYKMWIPIIGKMLGKGVRFPENIDNVAGPIVPPDGLATYAGERGKLITKKKGKTRHAPGGITFKIPEGMYDLDASKRGNPDIRWAVEWRSEDGQAYVYFDVHTWPAKMLQQQQMSVDTKADKRVGAWEAGAGEDVKLSKSGKAPYLRKGGSLLRFKGKWSYRFQATRGKTPYVELGCWGKQKTYIVWSRLQYGGIDAEKNKEVKKIVKAIKKGLSVK